MRILALVTDAFGGHGGIARYNRALLNAIARAGNVGEIVVLTRAGMASPEDVPPNAVQLPPSPSRIEYSLRACSQALLRGPFDVVFCGHLLMCPLAWAVARVAGAHLWLQIHGIEAWQRPGSQVRWAAERGDLVTAVSRHTRARFLTWAGIDPERVRVLPNTFEPRFTPGPKPPHLTERLGLAGYSVLLTVGRLAASERYKGHDRVIAALPEVLRQRGSVRYLVVGDGDDRARLESLAKAHGVAQEVQFVGEVPDSALPEYFRLADAFVMPSTGEGFGIVYLEAAASGISVIAGDRDGARDGLADGALGTLIDPDDQIQLAAAMLSALDRSTPTPAGPQRFASANFTAHVDAIVRTIAERRRAHATDGVIREGQWSSAR